jgi:acyl dehydratase
MPKDSSIPLLPPMSAATLLRALFKRPGRGGAATAHTRYLLPAIDEKEVARYRRTLGFEGSHVPLTYCYLPAQRAHLATMLDAAFPFRLVGIIHVGNRLQAGVAPAIGRPLVLRTAVQIDPPAASGAVHAHLDTQATQDGALVFTCRSSYLMVRGKRGGGPRPAPPDAREGPALSPLAGWPLSAASGREYAALSGDWNPIHLWPWSARLMGLKTPIIHGMHTLGRACAELERAGGRPLTLLDGRFRAPIALGSEARLAASLANGRYAVEADGRIAVEGRFDFDPAQSMLNT